MKSGRKKLLAGFLAFAMLITSLPTSVARAEGTESDSNPNLIAFDFGAEQIPGYTNMTSVEVINGLYNGVEGGADGKNLASCNITDSEGNVVFAFNDGGKSTTHRLRTSNTALTRYDAKEMETKNGEVLTGFIYSNSGSNPAVNVQFALKKNDILTFYVASNSGNSTIEVKSPSGETVDYAHEFSSANSRYGASVHNYYAKEDGLHTIYSINEKLLFARALIKRSTMVDVSGSINVDGGIGLKFINNETGEATEAVMNGSEYSVSLADNHTYTVTSTDISSYSVAGDATLDLTNGAVNKNFELSSVNTATFSGKLVGISANDLKNVEIKFTPFGEGASFVPNVEIDRTNATYSVLVEKDMEYEVSASNTIDSVLYEDSVSTSSDRTANIIFTKIKGVDVDVKVEGADDLTDGVVKFTRLDANHLPTEYVYEFSLADKISLIAGEYSVAVAGNTEAVQKLTTTLVVADEAVSKTVYFEKKAVETAIEYKAEISVAKDGSADYTTISDALAAVKRMTRENKERVVIKIAPGNYEEMLNVDVENVTFENTKADKAELSLIDKGVNIGENEVRITWYYGHGYNYYSMDNNYKYDADALAVNKANGYTLTVNKGAGSATFWNASTIISASGFEAKGIIFENSFNQYVSEAAAKDVIVKTSAAKEGATTRAELKENSTEVQDKKYVERAAALAITNGVKDVFFDNCAFIGRQDTLYGGTSKAAFYDCDIYGGTDYIFGPMTAVFAKCNLVANTMEDGNDKFYITAAQQKSGRGYFMYNCNVISTVPGVNTASKEVSKPGYLGRPWEANTSEVVFYATNIDGSSTEGASLISALGWDNSLSGTSNNVYEFGTNERLEGVDNSSKRVDWAKTSSEIAGAKLADGSDVSVKTFLGDWDPFAGKDMTIVTSGVIELPKEDEEEGTIGVDKAGTIESIYVLEGSQLTAFGELKEAKTEVAGTKDYFKIYYGAKSKVDNSSKTFADEYSSSQRINFGGKALAESNAIEFTTTTSNAEVKIWWAEAGDDKRQMVILNKSGEEVVKTDVEAKKNSPYVSTLKIAEPGKYYLGGDINKNFIFKVEVKETTSYEWVESKHTFEANTLTPFAASADNAGVAVAYPGDKYFTLLYDAKTKVDSSSKTYEDGYSSSQRLNLGNKASTDASAIKFTTTGKNAKVKIWWAESGDDNRQIAILDKDGAVVTKTSVTVAKNSPVLSTLTIPNPGTYYLGGELKGNYFFKVEVSEKSLEQVGAPTPERADWEKVAAPVIKSASQDENGNIVVVVEGLVGFDGADGVAVEMTSSEGKTTTKKALKEGNENTITFTPDASGKYSFVAKLYRDEVEATHASSSVEADFVLPLGKSNIVAVTNMGDGEVEVEYTAVAEAKYYIIKASCDGDTKTVATTDDRTKTVIKLEAGKTYSITVCAARSESDIAKESDPFTKKVEAKSERKWGFTTYGPSVSTSANGYTGSVADGKLTIYSENGKGKIVPGSCNDGLAFYYTEIDAKNENFTLEADIHVDKWTMSNGQEGFGLMVTDTIGKSGDTTVVWTNLIQNIVTKVEYYYDSIENKITNDTNASKITMKLGVGAISKTGVTAEDVAYRNEYGQFPVSAGKDGSSPENFSAVTVPLEMSCANRGTGAYNIVGNATTAVDGTVDNITDFHMSIVRNNTGYDITYSDLEGNVIGTKRYYDYDRDMLAQVDKDTIYVGFIAGRNARATATNIKFTTIDAKDDAPAEDRVIEKVDPSVVIESATTSNSEKYSLVYVGNFDGTLTVKLGDKVVADSVLVKADERKVIDTTLSYGNNEFTVIATPDKDFAPSEFSELTSKETITKTHTVSYKKYVGDLIYVAPNGKADGLGSKANPVDIYTAVKYASAGQTVVLAGGEYKLSKTVVIDRGIDGTSSSKITLVADPNATERPVFNFQNKCAGMKVAGNYWVLRGFDVTNSKNTTKGLELCGSNNVLEDIRTYKNGNTGLQVSRYLTTDTKELWPANNIIRNCTSFLNADAGYEDADGFAAKLTVGEGNVFIGCIAAYNADDGWDLYAKAQSGKIGKVTILDCVAFKNGYVLDEKGKEINAGNGNGFKMGGESLSGYHTLKNSIAFANKAKGIDSNSCPDIQVYNSVSLDNESYNVAFYTGNAVNTDFFAKNVISLRTKDGSAEQIKPTGKQDLTKIYSETNFYVLKDGKVSENSVGTQLSAGWFVSLAKDVVIKAATKEILNGTFGLFGDGIVLLADGSEAITRNADGTISTNGFLTVATDSPVKAGLYSEEDASFVVATASAEIKGSEISKVESGSATVKPSANNSTVTGGSSASKAGTVVAAVVNQVKNTAAKLVHKKTTVEKVEKTVEEASTEETSTEETVEENAPAQAEEAVAPTEVPADDTTIADDEVPTAGSSSFPVAPVAGGVVAVLVIIAIALVLKKKVN